jgi:hypothetical protein
MLCATRTAPRELRQSAYRTIQFMGATNGK